MRLLLRTLLTIQAVLIYSNSFIDSFFALGFCIVIVAEVSEVELTDAAVSLCYLTLKHLWLSEIHDIEVCGAIISNEKHKSESYIQDRSH